MGLTLTQLKKYTTGVLKSWLPNRDVLAQFEQKDKDVVSKLDTSEDGKTLLYKGKAIEGGGGGYGKRISVLYDNSDGSEIVQDTEYNNVSVASLSQPYTEFTTLRITVSKSNSYYVAEIPVDLIDSFPKHSSYDVSVSGIIVLDDIQLFKIFTEDNKKLGFSINDSTCIIVKIEGIFWEQAKIGRKLYTLYDMKEATKAIYTTEPDNQPEWDDSYNENGIYDNNHFPGYFVQNFDFRSKADGGLYPIIELPSIEDYDSIIISVQCVGVVEIQAIEDEMTDEQANSFYPIFAEPYDANVYEVPVDLIKENYGEIIVGTTNYVEYVNYNTLGINNENFGWIDKTHLGVGVSYAAPNTMKRINKIYGVRYETVSKQITDSQVIEAATETVEELNSTDVADDTSSSQ